MPALQAADLRGVPAGPGGRPTQTVVHMGLDRLRGLDSADAAEAAWATAAPGDKCDATMLPRGVAGEAVSVAPEQ